MASPARDARLLAIALGFTQVIGRGNSHIITRNPTTGKYAYDCQVGGGWHYAPGLETDTAWTAGVAPWNYQITKALYHAFALSNFKDGQIIKWLDPGSGQYVTFQPKELQWTNSLNQIQVISSPQSVTAQVSDDILYWPAAYGPGRNFRYQASPLRLSKQLIIDSPGVLPATAYDTLELNFIISVSSGVDIIVDGVAWDKKTTKDTSNSIAFRLLSSGEVLWSFAVPKACDSVGNETFGSMRLKKQGNSLYVSVRFPKNWIDTALFPIVIDPTVEYQVSASGDDGDWQTYISFDSNLATVFLGTLDDDKINVFARFLDVTIPAGATIDVAYISLYRNSTTGSPPACTIYFNDVQSPTAPTTYSNADAKTKTTASVSFTPPSSGTWINSPSIVPIISELLASYDYSDGAAMLALLLGAAGSGSKYDVFRAYDYSGNVSGPKLHIEYTEEVTSSWAGTWGG